MADDVVGALIESSSAWFMAREDHRRRDAQTIVDRT